MRIVLLCLVFLISLILGLTAMVPLSFAMRNAGLVNHGISWQQARGTIWNGQVTGLGVNGLDTGELEMQLVPAGLASGAISHDIVWTSKLGRGRARAVVNRTMARLRNVNAQVALAGLPNIPPEFRALDATASLAGGDIHLSTDGTCREASGTLSTNAISLIGAEFQANWPEMTGPLICSEGRFSAPLKGTGDNGETFSADISLLQDGDVSYDIRIAGTPDAIRNALILSGFYPYENGLRLTSTHSELER